VARVTEKELKSEAGRYLVCQKLVEKVHGVPGYIDRQDLVQEAALAFERAWHTHDGDPSSPSRETHAVRMAHFAVIDELRRNPYYRSTGKRQQRRPLVNAVSLQSRASSSDDENDMVLSDVIGKDDPALRGDPILRETLRQALAALTPTQRDRLVRSALGETQAEIAKEEGVTEGAISLNITAAIASMERFIAKQAA
jgi:RNA polymerase sigma factor (sigma-70 family)